VTEVFDQWAILELMGHIRVGGRVTEEQRFGGTMGRIDIPTVDNGFITQYFGASAVFRLTPTTEYAARMVAGQSRSAPVHPWEFPQLRRPINAASEEPSDSECGDLPFD